MSALHSDLRRNSCARRVLDVILKVVLRAVDVLLLSHIRSVAHAHIGSAHHLA